LGEPVFVVFNPASGKGRGARLVDPVLSALGKNGEVQHALTARSGDEARLTRDALDQGFRTVVAVGGDGTWSNVANALILEGASEVALGLVPAGTGCDFGKSLGIPANDIGACASIVRDGADRTLDVGRVEGRHFLNVFGVGFDVAVIEDSWKVTWLGGDLVYPYCALRQVYGFPGFTVAVSKEGSPADPTELLMLVIANARFFGGAFQIAPQADLEDGRLDCVAFANMPLMRRLRTMGLLAKGRHGAAPGVETSQGRSFVLRFDRPPTYETDGEWNQAKAAELVVECVPRALRVRVPKAS
jgi:YegS/Rv2252/BmrU family lipid kinase